METYFESSGAGRVLGLSRESVLRLVREEVLPVAALTDTGRRLFRREDLERVASERRERAAQRQRERA